MRICIIGNSHLASLKLAWENGLSAKYSDVQIVFFASLTANIEALVAVGKSLAGDNSKTKEDFKKTSNGLEKIDLSIFNYCVLHGLSPRTRAYLDLVVKSKDYFYSKKALNLANPLHQSPAIKLLSKIRTVSSIPVIFSPSPNALNSPSENNFEKSTFKEVCHLIKVTHKDIGAIYIPQPTSTIHCTYFTHSKYGKETRRMTRTATNTKEATKDYVHMNTLYGEKHLEKLLHILIKNADKIK